MNGKVEDLLIRLSKIPSATSLATELRSVLKTECVIVDKRWLEDNINSVRVYDREDGKVEETYEFRVRCIVNDGKNDLINDWKCGRHRYACDRIIEFMENEKGENK